MHIEANYIQINSRVRYYTYWDSIFYIDSVNVGVPGTFSSNLQRSSGAHGSSNGYLYFNSVSWPYTSNVNDISEKVVLKIEGGITCCRAYDDFYMRDDSQGTWTELWTDKVANITVYRTPSRSSGSNNQIYI